jgi:hypothetical protein
MLLDRQMNLDADGDLERFTAVNDAAADHENQWADVTAYDKCNAKELRYKLAPTGRRVSFGDIRGPSSLGRRAVLFTMAYGGRNAVARVIGLRLRSGQTCPTPYTFFAYSTSRPPKQPPAGLFARNFYLLPRNDSARYPGPELFLLEFYGPNAGDLVSKRETYFRYRNGRYVSYRSKLSRA